MPTNIQQQIADLESAKHAALLEKQERDRQRLANDPEVKIREAERQIAQLRQVEVYQQFEAAIAESRRLADETEAAARKLIDAIKALDMPTAIAAAKQTHELHQRLFQYNKSVLIPHGGLADPNEFGRLHWGIAINAALPVALVGVTGDELRYRNGIVYAIIGQPMQAGEQYTFEIAIQQTRNAAHTGLVRGGW